MVASVIIIKKHGLLSNMLFLLLAESILELIKYISKENPMTQKRLYWEAGEGFIKTSSKFGRYNDYRTGSGMVA